MSAEAHKVCGYLQRKAKGKLMSPWKRCYCVLNGRILIFYRNETDYQKLNSFSDVIDLGLVYSVDRAPGLDFGILLSTHNGPLWLRTRDPLSCSMWLESLQAAIVLRTPKEVLTQPRFNFDPRPAEHDPANEVKVPAGGAERKSLASRLFRFSLDLIPGHNYSTLDGRKLRESSYNDITAPATEKIPRRNGRDNKTQSMSGSVSNFLLMTSPDDGQNLLSVPGRAGKQTKRSSLSPRLPKSTTVTKLASFAEQNSEPGTPCKDDNSQPKFHTTAEVENKATKELTLDSVDCKPVNEAVKEHKTLEKQVSKKDNSKKAPRRKSSLALLKSFFFPAKQSKPPAQEEKEDNSSAKEVTQEKSCPTQKGSSLAGETKPACESLEYTEEDIEHGLDPRGEEEPKAAGSTATVVAVIEGPVEMNPPGNELMQEVFNWVQRMPEPNATDTPSRKRSHTECRPPLPIKLRQRFPSPPYDVPKPPRPFSAPSALAKQVVHDTHCNGASPGTDQCQSPDQKETGSRDPVQETESLTSSTEANSFDETRKMERDAEKDLCKPQEPIVITQEAKSGADNEENDPAEGAEFTSEQAVTDTEEVPCSPANAERKKGILDLVRFFDRQTTQDETQLLPAARLSKVENRLSFACSDIEIVEEETVQETVALLDA